MLKSVVSVQNVCDLLNEVLVMDYDCIHALVSSRVRCNEKTAAHETIQVQQYKEDPFPKVGMLGFLNGLFGIREDGMGAICMEVDNGKILTFKSTTPTALEIMVRADQLTNNIASLVSQEAMAKTEREILKEGKSDQP